MERGSLAGLKDIWPFVAVFQWRFLIALAFGFLASLMGLALPYLLGISVDSLGNKELEASHFPSSIGPAGISFALLITLLIQAVCIYLNQTVANHASELVVARMRVDLLDRLIRQPMASLTQQRVGGLTARLMVDLGELRLTLGMIAPLLVRLGTILIGSAVLMIITAPRLAIIMIAFAPVIGLGGSLLGRAIRRKQAQAQNRLATISGIAHETLAGIATVKAFHQERREITRFTEIQSGYLNLIFRAISLRALLVAFLIFALGVIIAAMVWRGVVLVNAGEMTAGTLTRFVLYAGFLGGSIAAIADRLGMVQKALGATESVRELLQCPHEEKSKTFTAGPVATESSRPIQGLVEFRNVHFQYESRETTPVLAGLSMSISPGEIVALVGPSGAGKSTIAALLLRFYETEQGLVLLDGRDVRSYPLERLRNAVGVVPQEIILFSGTIAENIAYGAEAATRKQIIEAARQANAHEFISTLPQGYETIVGERGVGLSGGQKQRIAIARCLIRNPAILILDEATSALDNESEKAVQAAMRNASSGRTTLIIAHRLSTVQMASRIAMIEGGRIIEEGSHQELLARPGGLYQKLLQGQMAEGMEL